MNLGIHYEIAEFVSEQNTASSYESGLLPVYATPAMIALMEKCACACVAPYLENGTTTVGTGINVRHVSASPFGNENYLYGHFNRSGWKKADFQSGSGR